MRRQLRYLPLVVAAATLLVAPATGQVILSDSFNRTTGVNDTPANGGFSDWGSTDNAAGGSASAGQSYLLESDASNAAMEVTDGANAVLNFGRVILDYNLAANANLLAAGGVAIQVDVKPSDTGGGSFNGRDWLGFHLADSNQLVGSQGAQFALTGGNADARVGIGPRNSGSAITRRGPANIKAGGNPNSLTEPIFDAATYSDYVAWFNGGDGTSPGDPVNDFVTDNWYTFRMVVTPDAGVGLFDDNALHHVEYFAGPQGGPLTQLDPDPSTGVIETLFSWGDNNTLTASGGSDTSPGVKDAYLVLVSNGPDHMFDNLVISAVPEPSAVALISLAVAGAFAVSRGR